jgi:hypothetical protein
MANIGWTRVGSGAFSYQKLANIQAMNNFLVMAKKDNRV